jgi:hypothetical protein
MADGSEKVADQTEFDQAQKQHDKYLADTEKATQDAKNKTMGGQLSEAVGTTEDPVLQYVKQGAQQGFIALPQANEAVLGHYKDLAAQASKVKKLDTTPFEEGSTEYETAKKIHDQKIPMAMWAPLFPARAAGEAKGKIFSTVNAMDPAYDWTQAELDYTQGKSSASAAGGLSQDNIQSRAIQSGAIERAKLAPDIVGAKASQQATNQSAKSSQAKLDAINSAYILLEHAKDPVTGKWDTNKVGPKQAFELSMAVAKSLSPQGALSEGMTKEINQKTLVGDFSGAAAYLGWNTAGTTEANLKILNDMLEREGKQQQKTYDIATTGKTSAFIGGAPKAITPHANIPTFNSPRDPGFDKLVSGEKFIDSNGITRVKK